MKIVYDYDRGCLVDKDTGEPIKRGNRKIEAPSYVVSDYEGYTCPITNKWIEGRKAHSENLKRHDCRVLEKGEREAWEKNRASEERQFERTVDEAVERTAAQLGY